MTKKEERTACIETRVNLLDLAAIAFFYRNQGVRQVSKSALLNSIISDYAALLRKNNLAPEVQTVDEAMEILSTVVSNPTEMLKKVRRNITEQLLVDLQSDPLQDMPKSGIDPQEVLRRMRENSVNNGGHNESDE